MNYDNIFLFLFLSTIITLSFLLFHKQLEEPTTLLVSGRYHDVSDKELKNKIKEIDKELDKADKLIAIAAAKMRGRDGVAKSEYVYQVNRMRALLKDRKSYADETELRTKKLRYAYGIAFIVCLVIFIELNRRVISYRDPRRRKKLKLKKQMDKWDKTAKTQRPAEVLLGNMAAPPPPGIFPGKTTMENIVHLIGEPHQRSTFQGLEAWIFYLEPEYLREKTGITEIPIPESMPDQTGNPDVNRLAPLSIIFRGDLVQNYAIAKIDDAAGMKRFL